MKTINVMKLVVSIVVCQAAGIVGALATRSEISTWYATLAKPWFRPPDWLFGPVWVTLYLLMAIALFLVWRQGWDLRAVRIAMMVFAVQLVLNAIWSFLFFGLHSPLLGLIDIVLLWVAIVATMAAFYRVSQVAMWLLVPYILWVSFAAVLNFSIWRMNSGGGA